MSDIAFSVIINNNGIDDIIFKTIMLKGEKGNSVDHVEKTSTSGLVDTYTIYLSDGTVGGTFTVTNGAPVNIDDSVTALDKTWSSSKLSGMIKSIDDTTVDADKLWSSQKINSMVAQTGTIEDVAIASFADGADDVPVSSLIVDINAVQAGSGTPSPTNVRAISGWSECNVIKNGFNLCDEVLEYGNINTSGNNDGTSRKYVRTKNYQNCKPQTLFCFYAQSEIPFGQMYAIEYDINKNFIARRQVGQQDTQTSRYVTFTTGENTNFIRLFIYSSTDMEVSSVLFNINISDDSKNGTYQPHDGGTDTIDFGQTVYGGTLNVSTGEMTVTDVTEDMGNLTWYRTTSYTNPMFYSSVTGKEPIDTGFMCEKYKYLGSFSSASSFSSSENYTCGDSLVNTQIYVRNDDYSDADSFKTAMTGTRIKYRLATPQTIQLTPTEVRTLLNENHIFADTGNVDELIYFKTGSETIARLIEAYLRGE